MSTGLDGEEGGGGGGRQFFLSTHRCPEVDLLPHHKSKTQTSRLSSAVPAEKSPGFTCAGQSDANYLNITTTCRSAEEEVKQEEDEKQVEEQEEEGSISDWSEEDLSLHFSPSVILPSDEEESDPESSFECVDVTMETQVSDWGGVKMKMVPKRQIQLKKRKDAENSIKDKTEKLQVIQRDGPSEGTAAQDEVSANELCRPIVRPRPDLVLRQHSMPTCLHTCSTTCTDGDNYRVYRGLVAGASQGFHVGGNSRQRLQKSFSLDETKTKMASCIIKSVLSKKMQVEQNSSDTCSLQKKLALLPNPLQAAEQQEMKGGAKTGGGVFKAPVHVVRDMRNLVKNTYSLSFSTAPTKTPANNKPTSFKVIGQDESPPPTYQQAVGVKGQEGTRRDCQASVHSRSSRGHAQDAESQDRKQINRFTRPITQQRRGSEPIINRREMDDVTWPVLLAPPNNFSARSDRSQLSQSETSGGVSHQAGIASVSIHSPPSTSKQPKVNQTLLSPQEQASILGVAPQCAPSSSQQMLHSCFYPPAVLPTPTSTLRPHVGKASYVHSPLSPLSLIQTQPIPPPAPTLHILRRPEENRNGSSADMSNHPEQFIKSCPPHRTKAPGDPDCNLTTVSPAAQEQHEHRTRQQQLQPQQLLWSAPCFLPAEVGGDLHVDLTSSAAAPRALLSAPSSCHMMVDPASRRCFYVDVPPQPQRKMLLDPETGQYVQVLLPAARPAPFGPSWISSGPAVLSVMQLQPTMALSSLYAPPGLPLTLHTPSVNFTRTAP